MNHTLQLRQLFGLEHPRKDKPKRKLHACTRLKHTECDVSVKPCFNEPGVHDCHGQLLTSKNVV